MKKKFYILSANNFREPLKEIADWAEEQFHLFAFPQDKIWIPSLCLEEVVTNIILHGIQKFPAEIDVEIQCSSLNEIEIKVIDSGVYFDIQSHIAKRRENQIGGAGIPLIRSLMQIKQAQVSGKNWTQLFLKF